MREESQRIDKERRAENKSQIKTKSATCKAAVRRRGGWGEVRSVLIMKLVVVFVVVSSGLSKKEISVGLFTSMIVFRDNTDKGSLPNVKLSSCVSSSLLESTK